MSQILRDKPKSSTAGIDNTVSRESTARCVFIASSWSDRPVSVHFRALASELARRGNRVVLLVDQQRVDVTDETANPAVYTWPSRRPTKLRDAKFLAQLIRQHRPDALIANFGAVNVMLLVGWLLRVPVRVAWYRTLSGQIDLDWTRGRWLRKLLLWRKQTVYKAATNIVANTEATSRDVQNVGRVPPQKCRVFYNSLPDPLAAPSWNVAAPSKRQEFVSPLVCVGRLHPSKGQEVVIRAAHKLRESMPNFHIDFVGDGPARDNYQQLIDDLGLGGHCTLRGHLSHQQVLERMAGAYATIVPSRSEAFGLVNIESLAVGTPVVASAVDGIVEILTDGREGYLVPPGDADSLCEKLKLLLEQPALREKMSVRARERFLSFEQSKCINEQADWFESLVDSRAKKVN